MQALAFLFHSTTYMFPIVGVNTVEHVKAMPDAMKVKLSKEEMESIRNAAPFHARYPMSFLYNWTGGQEYSPDLTAANSQQYQMGAWINAPPKPLVSNVDS